MQQLSFCSRLLVWVVYGQVMLALAIYLTDKVSYLLGSLTDAVLESSASDRLALMQKGQEFLT